MDSNLAAAVPSIFINRKEMECRGRREEMESERVWNVGLKPVDRKSENERVGILPHKAENHKAEKI